MRPQQQITAILHILFDTRCSVLGNIREIPDVIGITSFNVAQPEEHAIIGDILHSADIAEIYILTLRIVLMEPQPCAGLIIVAVGNKFLRCSIFREETRNLTANLG